MTDGWPVCDTAVRLMGSELRCHLPKHHEWDGQTMHEDEVTGTHWAITFTMPDGSEKRL